MTAVIAMLADHVGAVFFPDILILRMIGRLTAPIMAFFIAEGYTKTRNVFKYEMRLFTFAVISMLPYRLLFGHSPFNILFDLLLGLLTIDFSQRFDREYQKWGLVLLAAVAAFCLETDGRLGISTLVYLFYYFRNDRKSAARAMAILYLGSAAVYGLYSVAAGDFTPPVQAGIWLWPMSLMSLPLISCYNGERGRGLKYFFYGFYPAHLIFLYVVKSLL